MTTKTAPCIARPQFGIRESSRKLNEGAPRHASLTGLVRQPWMLRVGRESLLTRPATPRDLPAVAAMHARCTPQTILDRYRLGGKKPAVVAVEQLLRRPLSFLACTNRGEVRAMAVAAIDTKHGPESAEVGLLVEDDWQSMGIGRELTTHLAGAALVCGYAELIAYTATTVVPAQRMLLEVGHTRVVMDSQYAHLHTYLPESAALGLGAVREQLAS